MAVFNAGDRVRIDRDADYAVQADRLVFPYLATVLTSGVINGVVHIEWDADDGGGPYEDEYDADRLVHVDSTDAHYLQLASDTDAILQRAGEASCFYTDFVVNLFGSFSEEVEEWRTDTGETPHDVSDEEITDTLRLGNFEVLIDDVVCFLHPHGYTLASDGDNLHRIVKR